MNRATFKAAVQRKLRVAFDGIAKPNDSTWAEEITKTYFDECPNEYTPAEAVSEELSNA